MEFSYNEDTEVQTVTLMDTNSTASTVDESMTACLNLFYLDLGPEETIVTLSSNSVNLLQINLVAAGK